MCLIYPFLCLSDSNRQNLYISCIIFQLMEWNRVNRAHALGSSIYAQYDLYRNHKVANLSPKYHASRATVRSCLQYVYGHYPATVADLFVVLKGAHP